jgi:Fic family protein
MKEYLTARLLRVKQAGLKARLDHIDRVRGIVDMGIKAGAQVINRLKQNVLVTSTGASTRIEGSQMSDEGVKKLLGGLKVTKLKDRDSQEVAGYGETIKSVFDNYKDIKFSENSILHLHKMTLEFSDKDGHHRGKYKNQPNIVEAINNMTGERSVVFSPTEPYLAPIEMKAAIEWADETLKAGIFHPVPVIANFILEFLVIHPFQDGNGRLSRILTNLLLLKQGYTFVKYASHEKIIEDNKERYYIALREGQKFRKTEKCDASMFVNFFTEVLGEQAGIVEKIAGGTAPEKMISERQGLILGLFGKYDVIKNADVVKELNIPSISAAQALKRLEMLGLIERIGTGRGVRYKKK